MNQLSQSYEILDIAPEEAKYYIAKTCRCSSFISFGGKKDLNVVKECFHCGRKWKMIDVYIVHVIEILNG